MKPCMALCVSTALLLLVAGPRPCSSQVGAEVSIDALGIGQAVANAVNAAQDREACLAAAREAAYTQSGGLNVMVFNLRQRYDFSRTSDDVKFFNSFQCADITFGVWAFCQGTFTNQGDGGFINWTFMGDFIRDPPDSATVIFNNVC